MSDNLQKYVPEFDDDDARAKLAGFSKDELTDMLIRSYKMSRIFAKLADEGADRLRRIHGIIDEPSKLSQMPDIPDADDLRKLWDK